MKDILVLASGGLDSTYLIYDNLKKGNNVTALYVTVENNPTKNKSELMALELIRKYFQYMTKF